MSEFTDEQLLGYIETHSHTERALVSNAHVRRLCELARMPMPPECENAPFIRCKHENIWRILSDAKANLRRRQMRLVAL